MKHYLNADVLKELQSIMGDDINMLFEVFLDDTLASLEELALVIDSTNYDKVRRIAHSIKGSSKNVGADDLANICELLEQAARDECKDNWTELLTNIQESFNQTKNEINQNILN